MLVRASPENVTAWEVLHVHFLRVSCLLIRAETESESESETERDRDRSAGTTVNNKCMLCSQHKSLNKELECRMINRSTVYWEYAVKPHIVEILWHSLIIGTSFPLMCTLKYWWASSVNQIGRTPHTSYWWLLDCLGCPVVPDCPDSPGIEKVSRVQARFILGQWNVPQWVEYAILFFLKT